MAEMQQASLRFYAELNDFLRTARRGLPVRCDFWTSPTVKDIIESCGVPHGEVDLILVNGVSEDFSYRLRDGDRISVYPRFRALDIRPQLKVRPEPPSSLRFVVDVNLGRLALYLRLLGFDVLYRNNYADEDLAEISEAEDRILLSRDIGLLKRSQIAHGYFLRADQPRAQLQDVVKRFELAPHCRPLTRCLHCNGEVIPVDKATVLQELHPGTLEHVQDFYRCTQCGKVYWQGAHFPRIRALLQDVGVAI